MLRGVTVRALREDFQYIVLAYHGIVDFEDADAIFGVYKSLP